MDIGFRTSLNFHGTVIIICITYMMILLYACIDDALVLGQFNFIIPTGGN